MFRPLVVTLLALSTLAVAVAGVPHRVCLLYTGGDVPTFYDISTGDGSLTEMKRWDMSKSPPQLLDTNTYAELHQPNPPGSHWGDGVAFAATMQTRHAWINMDPTTSGWWDILSPTSDRWRFQTTVNGNAVELVFTTANCVSAPPISHRVCLQYANGGPSTFYDITTSPTETSMKRWDMSKNPPQLLDTNTYASLAPPHPPGSHWGDGVAFTATMQTRHAWINMDPTTAGWWDILSATSDRWRFQTSINGNGVELVFTTDNCVSAPGQGQPT
jgi:hypothetical protein